jgi:hypothetical protein
MAGVRTVQFGLATEMTPIDRQRAHRIAHLDDEELFVSLVEGIDEKAWDVHALELRLRGYSIFDMGVAQSAEADIISPDCLNRWQLKANHSGRWQII